MRSMEREKEEDDQDETNGSFLTQFTLEIRWEIRKMKKNFQGFLCSSNRDIEREQERENCVCCVGLVSCQGEEIRIENERKMRRKEKNNEIINEGYL